mgnify:FL=1
MHTLDVLHKEAVRKYGKANDQLTKAKEIIEKLYNQVYGRCGADWELIEQAEQFLNRGVVK